MSQAIAYVAVSQVMGAYPGHYGSSIKLNDICNHEYECLISYHSATVTETSTKKNKHYLICGCLFIIFPLLLMIIVLVIVLSQTPRINNNPGPNMVRPLLTNRPTVEGQTRLLEVDFGTDPFWVSQADFQIEDCTGTVLTIQGVECHELPRKVIKETTPSRFLYYAYLLPGSVVNISVADTIDNSGVEVWAMNSEAWKLTDLGLNLDSCSVPSSGSSCFLAQSKAGQTFQQEIEKADFYFYFTNRLSNGVRFTHVAEQYLHNLTEVRQLYSPTETDIIRDRSQTVTISPIFDFQQNKCVMLSSSCTSTQSHAVTIGNLKRRMDLLVFPGVVGIIVLLVALSVVSVYIAVVVWSHWKRKYKSKTVMDLAI